jgi:hypothetical protein
MNEAQVAGELKGNTLRVYWQLLRFSKSSIGPRDIQRKLGFSSPNLAVYHLDKLVDLGLAEKILGEYHLTRTVDVGVVKQFTNLGGFFVPQRVLYASMWTTLFVFYISQFREISFYSVYAMIFGILGTGILWFETWRDWTNRPR